MANPIIDAIQWDVNNPTASALLLQTQLDALQAEWDTKLSRQLRLTSVGQKSLASFQSLPNHRADSIDQYVGFDPSIPAIDASLSYVRGELTANLPFAGSGHSERLYLSQTSVLSAGAAGTNQLFSQSVTLPRPAFVRGWHPLVIKSSAASPCDNLYVPLIDGTQIFSGTVNNASSPNPGISFYPLIVNSENFVIVEWSTDAPISAGVHTIALDIRTMAIGGATIARTAPFFNLYTSAIEAGTMPVTYVQPPLSYLEFIYQ